MQFIIILSSSLLSGLLGVIVSTWYYRRNEIRQAKFRIVQQLLGNRFDIRGLAFTEALNAVFVVFHDSQEVLLALKAFHETIIGGKAQPDLANQKLMELFKAVCEDIRISPGPLTDNFFLQAFNIRQ